MEYQTALKDYEQIVLEFGNREMMKANTVERNDVNERNRYGHRYVLVEKDGHTIIKEITKKRYGPVTEHWEGYLQATDLIDYVTSLNLGHILLHTEVNVHGCKLNGNPITSRQDWIEVEVEGKFFQVHFFQDGLYIGN